MNIPPYKLISILIFLCLPIGLLAQQVNTGHEASIKFSNAELVRDSQFSPLPSFIKFRQGQQIEIDEFKTWMKANFDIAQNMDFLLLRKENDNLGHTHYRYQQTINGKPIEDAIWIAHTKGAKIYSVNGLIYDKMTPESSASLSEDQALEKAKNHVGAETFKWEVPSEEAHLKWETQDQNATYYPKGELVYVSGNYQFNAESYHLAYKFNVYAHNPISRSELYVDANTGQILRENEIIHHVDEPGTAHTAYSGERDIIADSFGGEYRLHDGSRGDGVRTFDLNESTSHGDAVDFIDDDNDWDNANPELDEYATDAHWGAEMTYDYFLDEHGRNSIDNSGFQLNNYVHYGVNYYNAFWDGSRMTFGDGNGGSVTPLTSIDIAGHEVAHGLTTFTAGLIYYAESGALNESFSDIFGAAIERFARPDDYNWLLGEDIGTHFRNMANPNAKGDPDTYFGDFWASLMGGDSGGVHTNSGVQNFWYYLLTEGGSGTNDNGDDYDVTALGVEAASAIAFRNLTVYLISSSQYADARFYSLQAAEDIFGGCTVEIEETANAWYAVGVGDLYDPTTTADFSSLDTFGCFIPFEVNFTNESFNAISYAWDFGDGGTSTEENPSHVYLEEGLYTVELIVDGGACGADTITYVDFIEVDPDADCIITLPPNGTLGTQSACEGTIYDSGGDSDDYGAGENSQVTIAPLGAVSVNLTFPFFDVEPGPGASCGYDYIEVFDGPDEFAPLIGRYCNTFPPSDITSIGNSITITFHSDGGLELDGFEIEWTCNPPDDVPETDFIVNAEINCGGASYFTDLSSNIPIAWDWDFGDGETSSDQNPIHTYTDEGVYTVTLIATNLVGSSTETKVDYVTVSYPDEPAVEGDTNCFDQTATLNATGEGVLKWYDAPSGGSLVYEGETFITPELAATTTYYVEDDLYDSPEFVGPVDSTFATGDYYIGDQYLIFDNPNPAFLKSVKVYAGSSGERTIELRDNAGDIIESILIDIPAGESTVILDLNLPIGTNMQLGTADGSEPDLFRNDIGTTYPYSLSESVEITGSSSGPELYYYFYNWEVHPYNCASARVPVTAEVEFESDIVIEPVEYICVQDEAVILSPSEGGGTWTSDCIGCVDETSGEFDPEIAGLGTWEITYTVEGTCSYLNTITIDVVDSDITIDSVETLCVDDAIYTLSATEEGGTWTADCDDCVETETGEFDPGAAGVGTWEITYWVEGTCSHYNTIIVNVVDSDITIDAVEDICLQGGSIILSGSEGGGTWSADCGPCIDPGSGEFDPEAAGEGEWVITYSVEGTCSHYNTETVNVIDCLGLPNNATRQISIYPNPSRGIVQINTGQLTSGSIQISDVIGKTVGVIPFNTNTFSIDLNDFHAQGTYFVSFYDEQANLITIRRIVKQ